MEKGKLMIGFAATLAILMAMIAYGAVKIPEYNRYHDYLSAEMTNRVTALSKAILENEKVLAEVAASKTVTEEQAAVLESHFRDIMIHAQDMNHLALQFERVTEGEIRNEAAATANEANFFFLKLRQAGMPHVLDEDQAERVKRFQALGLDWANQIRTHIPVMESTEEGLGAITDPYWVDLIVDLEQVTSRKNRGET
jgi:hypothetical protein